MGIFDDIRNKLAGKQQDPKVQTPDEIALVAYIKEKIEECKSSTSRTQNESEWMTNTAYLVGYDGVAYDSQTKQFKNIGLSPKNARKDKIKVNKILPTVQNRTARLCKQPPKYEIRPESNSEDDKEAAKKGLHVIDYIWEKQKVDEKRISMIDWLQRCGHSYMVVSWDDELGEPLVGQDMTEGEEDTLEPQSLDNPEEENNEVLGFQGDVRVDTASAFEIYVDPLAKDIEDAQWVVRARVRKLNYFRDRYGERGAEVKEEQAWLLSTQYEMRINSIGNNNPGGSSSGQLKNAAIEIVYYEKRSKKHPRGRQVICANGILLDDKELPIGEIPVAKFDDIVVGGKFTGEAVVTHLRPVQDYFNENVRKRNQFLRNHLAGKFLSPRGAGLHAEALDNESGEIVEYDPVPNAGEPHQLQQPTIPEYAFKEEQACNQWINDISGINEVSRGTLPSASIPALGMQILQEADETRMGIMLEQHQHGYANVARFILKFADKYYKIPRKIKLEGDGMGYEYLEFKSGDLNNNYDVCVVSGSMTPRSKALKRQDIMNALQIGAFNIQDPKIREVIVDALEFGDVDELFEDHAITMAQIKNDIEKIKNGDIPEVNELDNHQLHLIHKNYMRIKNQISPFLDDYKKLILDHNIEQHLECVINLTNPGMKMNEDMAKAMDQASQDPAVMQQAVQMNQHPGNPVNQLPGNAGGPMPQQGVSQ